MNLTLKSDEPQPDDGTQPASSSEQRRSVLVATLITLVVVPLLALYNLSVSTPDQTVNLVVSTHGATSTDPEAQEAAPAPTTTEASVTTTESSVEVEVVDAVAADPVTATEISDVDDDASSEAITTTSASSAPTTAPLTVAPTTAASATAAPTAAPSTVAPTTAAPTTAAPTTAAPTTAAPSTAAPTTAAPTTAAPTTAAPAPPTTASVTDTTETTVPLATSTVPIADKVNEIVPTAERWQQLSICESGGRWDINTGNGYYGGLQFSLSSWRFVGGSGYPHQATMEEQIYRAELLWEIQGWKAWPACSLRLGFR